MTFRTSALRLGVAAAALAFTAGTAAAELLSDTTLVWGYRNGVAQAGPWADVLGDAGSASTPGFQTTSINGFFENGSVVLVLTTNWRIGAQVGGANSGDIWLDLDMNPATGTGGFESAIVFDPANNPGPNIPVYTRAPVGFYNGTGANTDVTWRTVNSVWAGSETLVGGRYCAPGTACSGTSPAPETQPETLSIVNAAGPNPNPSGTLSAVNFESGIRITISNLSAADRALFNIFNIGWGTADCGNDTIVGTIPVPAALPLMLTALAGLGLVARRRSGDSA